MTVLNQLDTGASHPWPNWSVGQVLGSVLVERAKTIYYPRGRKTFSQQASFWVQAWQALGGAAARSMQARLYLLAQLEELAGNPDLQPVYIRWTQTDDPSAPYATAELHDGWYNISDFQADYRNYIVTGPVKVALTVERVAPPPPNRVGYGYASAPLGTIYVGSSATPVYVVGFPANSSYPGPVVSRTGAEGSLIGAVSPTPAGALINPVSFGLSATVSDWWKGGVRVYDTINTGSNPVPTSVGTFVNANWVEALGPDRYWQGDAFLTNGLLGFLFQAGQARLCQVYLWNTALVGGAAWQLLGELRFASSSQVNCTCQGYSFDRLGSEESSIGVTMAGAGAATTQAVVQLQMRLQRFYRLVRIAITALADNFNSGSGNSLSFVGAPTGKMIVYNPSAAGDAQVETIAFNAPNTANDGYGYAGVFYPGSGTPYHAGFLYQAASVTPLKQPQTLASPTDTVYMADGPGAGSTRYYGFWAIPFPTTQNAQAEGEGGTLGTGWTSVADSGNGASGGNTARCASGTLSGNADLFGTAWQPPQDASSNQRYIVVFRVRVTSAAGATPEMTLGLWDATASAFVTNGSTTFAANALGSIGYHWLLIGTNPASPVKPPSGHNVQFRAVTAGTLGTDWFVDEAILLPVSRSNLTTVFPIADQDFPQDLFQQFLGDRDVRMLRL